MALLTMTDVITTMRDAMRAASTMAASMTAQDVIVAELTTMADVMTAPGDTLGAQTKAAVSMITPGVIKDA